MNGGGLPCEQGEVAYFAPDALAWQGLGQGKSDFMAWALTGDLDAFYASLRWAGWEAEAEAVPPGSGLAIYPPLFSQEALADLGATSRRAVPWREVVEMQQAMAAQLSSVPDGAAVQVSVCERSRADRTGVFDVRVVCCSVVKTHLSNSYVLAG